MLGRRRTRRSSIKLTFPQITSMYIDNRCLKYDEERGIVYRLFKIRQSMGSGVYFDPPPPLTRPLPKGWI